MRSVISIADLTNDEIEEIFSLADDADKAHRDVVERLLLAAARADLEAVTSGERQYVVRLRRAWGDALAAFLEVR